MSQNPTGAFDLDEEPSGQLSANAHWLFGSLYAVLVLVGFSFGIWAGAQKPKAIEIAETKKEYPDKPAPKLPVVTPPTPTSEPTPEPQPPPTPPEPKVKEPETKPKDPPKPDVKPVAFKEVVPILRTYCFDCHGGSTGKPKGDVDLTSIAKMLGSKGPPLVPGKPLDSTIYTSTAAGDMPKERKGPSQAELKLLHDWIASGAKERRRTIRGRRLRIKLELTAEAEAG